MAENGPTGCVLRPTWAEVDLAAVEHNAALLASIVAPGALCAVVKADAYGHGAVAVARAALRGGAAWLAVALVEEGVELRMAGIEAPVLLLSEPPQAAMGQAVAYRLTPTLYSVGGVRAFDMAAQAAAAPVPVHVKVDTGMHRVGASPEDLPAVVEEVMSSRHLAVGGLWTHLAMAGEGDGSFTVEQLARFDRARQQLALGGQGLGSSVILHVANSAGTIVHPEARLDMVRCGIALYGELPSQELGPALSRATGGGRLHPALSLKSRIAFVRELPAGSRLSYGRCTPLPERSVVATVPIGYADGMPRALFSKGASVLIGGRRRRLAGMVTMDQIMVDCGPDAEVAVGDEVVLIGKQGDEEVTAGEWASLLGGISYEVFCGIGARVPRIYPTDRSPRSADPLVPGTVGSGTVGSGTVGSGTVGSGTVGSGMGEAGVGGSCE